MNKKTISILLLFILLISICTILIVNAKPELTSNLTAQSIAVFKQYVKVFGFLSVMALVYLGFSKSKEASLDEEYIKNMPKENKEIEE